MLHRLASLFLAVMAIGAVPPSRAVSAAEIGVVQLGRFDELHNGSIDVDSGVGHNLRQEGQILCNVLLEGPIEKGDLDRLKAVVGAQRDKQFSKPPRLCLHSPGGSYREGLAIANYLMEHSIGTAVPAGGECYSACAIIFMGGTYPWKGEINRYLHVQAVLGFHAPYIPDSNNKNRVMVDEGQVGAAYSEGIKAMKAFMELGVGNPTKRIVPELMQEMVGQGPNDFFFVDTIGKAIRFRIHLYGIDRPSSVDAQGICNACVNMNYGAYERYGRGGEPDLCAGLASPERQPFANGVRYTNPVAPRGGACSVDVTMKNGQIANWMYRNDERSPFGDGLELAYWYLLSPSTKIASLSKPPSEPSRTEGGGERDDSEAERLRRALFNFVVIEYLGHGRADHRDRPDLFAPRVNYYKKGIVTREALLADKTTYYKRWPKRRYELIKDSVQVARGGGDSIEVTFRYGFEVANDRETRRGTGVARLSVQLTGGQFSIVSEDGEVERRQ
jgi:hypothetical protein